LYKLKALRSSRPCLLVLLAKVGWWQGKALEKVMGSGMFVYGNEEGI